MNRCIELEKWNFYFTLPSSISRTGRGVRFGRKGGSINLWFPETMSGNGTWKIERIHGWTTLSLTNNRGSKRHGNDIRQSSVIP